MVEMGVNPPTKGWRHHYKGGLGEIELYIFTLPGIRRTGPTHLDYFDHNRSIPCKWETDTEKREFALPEKNIHWHTRTSK